MNFLMWDDINLATSVPLPLSKPNLPARDAIIAFRSVREILLKHVETLDNQIKKIGQ